MGIGVSYTGHDGRTREFSAADGAEAKRTLDGMLGEGKRHVGDALRSAMRGAQVNVPSARQQAVDMMPGGSVVRGLGGGICLRGEDMNPLVEGVRMFGSVNGRKGFFTFNEMDPAVDAPVVGATFDCDDVDANAAELDFGRPGKAVFGGRVKMDRDDAGQIILYQMMKEITWSAGGRETHVSGEKRRVIGSFMPGEEGGAGSGRYGVRAFWDDTSSSKPTLVMLAFGSEEDLDTYNPSTNDFDCNRDGDIRVFMVATAACSHGISDAGGS